ncbi:RecA-like DNA recombinase [Gordonia phage RedWattleHog]|uniref:RecA-like DNA recombinase n=1 Tax=Gordonia phage Stormageddon TaxID=2656541 RepID=A0A649VR02_9CAUD|nr:RecA-like DNA recombinase [Gordonia phage Stormageddon]QGJ94940.1 RecA-like DNA recombinase [Gordonia phage Stormageddon]QLF83584.1 RecA-like DNA recombinase [Gordonia phage RedWattleHog]
MTKAVFDDKVVEKINKEFGSGSIMKASELPPIPMVSSGSLALDFAIGAGGIPTNRVVEVCGSEGAGKTTLALLIARQIIDRNPKRGLVYIDLEHKITPSWMEMLVGSERMDNIMVVSPDSIEQTTEIYRRLVKSGKASMVIVDSIGGAPTNQAMDDTRNVAEKAASMGGNSKGVSEFARLANNLSSKYDCLTVGINQTRDDTKSRHGNMLQTPGGHAWKHACVLRIELRRGSEKYQVKRGGDEVTVGFDVRAKIHKNQLGGQEGRTCEWRFFTEATEQFGPFGIDTTEECVRLAKAVGVVTQAGAYYRHPAFPDGQVMGGAKMLSLIQEDVKVREAVIGDVMDALSKDPEKLSEIAPIDTDEDDPVKGDDEPAPVVASGSGPLADLAARKGEQ